MTATLTLDPGINRQAYYPLEVSLPDGTPVQLRPLGFAREDARAHLDDLARARRSGGAAGDDHPFQLLALADSGVVAAATLEPYAAGGHTGAARARLRLDPDFDRRGLGPVLLRELLDLTFDLEIDRLILELDGQPGLYDAAVGSGFLQIPAGPDDRPSGRIQLEFQPGAWLACAPVN
jgi:GNAT superfamily N-acetyltransferase